MKIALLSNAVTGYNSGDAFIEDAVRRLVVADQYERFPLAVTPLTPADIEAINHCDAALICGTNLYQQKFNCNLDVETIDQIRVPIIPMGIGSSAGIGSIPQMNEAGVQAVRRLHERCAVSSVRDPGSFRFLQSIGVRNTMLTACPVLFHGLSCPDFRPSGEGHTLSVRARLLHIDAAWERRQEETLDLLCARYRPTLVLQSPYDEPIATALSEKYGVGVLMNHDRSPEPYIELTKRQEMTYGFRLHFGMLGVSYGKPAYFIGHDSRVSEFCEMMGLHCFDITKYSDNSLLLQIDARSFPAELVRRRWREMSIEMTRFLKANGLKTRLETDEAAVARSVAVPAATTTPAPAPELRRFPVTASGQNKPRILMLMDRPNWSFDHSAQQIARHLHRDFRFEFEYVTQTPTLDARKYDLIYVFFWGEKYYQKFGFDTSRVIKELSSHRWEDAPQYGPCRTPDELVKRYLSDAASVICTSRRLVQAITGHHPHVYHTPNGYDPTRFYRAKDRTGPLTIGWAGNPKDQVKGLDDLLRPACEGQFNLVVAEGGTPHAEMNLFYNGLDVFAVSSKHEGEPLTLVEAMAAGCFPVSSDVGIASELIRSGENGLIVSERTPEAFREAFAWCAANLDSVRNAGVRNAVMMQRERSWSHLAPYFKRVFIETLERAEGRASSGGQPRDLDLYPVEPRQDAMATLARAKRKLARVKRHVNQWLTQPK